LQNTKNSLSDYHILKSLHNCKPNTGAFEGRLWGKEIARSDLSGRSGGVSERLRILSPVVEQILENPGASPHRKTQKNIFFLLKRAADKEINFLFCCFLPARAKNIFRFLLHTENNVLENFFPSPHRKQEK
jgi:hypothetical protein